jgi:hypothetical protein
MYTNKGERNLVKMAAGSNVFEEMKVQITLDDSSNLESDQYLDYIAELKNMGEEK